METGRAVILGSCLVCATAIILFMWQVIEIRRTYVTQHQSADDPESQAQSRGEDPSHPQVQNPQPSVSPRNTPAENSSRPNGALNVPYSPLLHYLRGVHGLETPEDASSIDNDEGPRRGSGRSPGPRMDPIPEEGSSRTVDITELPPHNQQIQHSENSRIPRQVPISIPHKTHTTRVSSDMHNIPSTSSLNDRGQDGEGRIRSQDSMANGSSESRDVRGRGPLGDILTYRLGESVWRPKKSTSLAHPNIGEDAPRFKIVSGEKQAGCTKH
ncbi:MAG: hypothetical protein Q9211_006398 [Gyalolechia sp. 1 TL-2023]